ncbi:MAG: TlpA family protein disulfide reductase [Alcaligenaceae bacterium]|nr:TlpA family protein disulfide reductase [Alcaligenaceae bacterium]
MNKSYLPIQEWHISQWFNTQQPLHLSNLRGHVVMIHAFQMLCPGCVLHAIPQAVRVHQGLASEGLKVIGLHTVFEHHDAMQPHALEAFIHEYRLRFPIGVDTASEHSHIPKTMAQWGLQGTPSLLVLDRQGHIRLDHFGQIDDIQLGALLGRLLAEPDIPRNNSSDK